VETGFKKPAARMDSTSKDEAKIPGRRYGYSNPDLNRPTETQKLLSSSSKELDKSGSKAAVTIAVKKLVKPTVSVTSTGSSFGSRLQSSSLKPRGVAESTKKSPLKKK
jgi:hypothetical protein